MGKKILRIAVLLLTACILTGCTSWMVGYHYSVKPHVEESAQPTQASTEVDSFDALRDSLADAVMSGRDSCVIYVSGFSETKIHRFMDIAIHNVKYANPMGSYAVDEIDYEIGTSAGRQAVAVKIMYNRTRSEILRIKHAKSMQEANRMITTALENCDAGVVVKTSKYKTTDFTQMIQDYVDENPDLCMEMPQIAIGLYPNRGTERVIELTFTYQNSREDLRSMQDKVRPIFSSAELYVSGDGEKSEKYAQLYSFLMERFEYQLTTSITPSYSLLRHGVGDSKAFATVYAAMCRRADLNCKVVSGTKDGKAHYWNAILVDGVYHYLDLLQCNTEGSFVVLPQEEMTGYVWDYSAFETD